MSTTLATARAAATMMAARGFGQARLARSAPLSAEPPDQHGRPRDIGQDAQADRQDTQAVVLQPGRHGHGAGQRAKGSPDALQA